MGTDLPYDASSGPFRGSQACREGRTTPKRLRGPTFVPLYPDTYVGADLEVTLAVRRQALRVRLGDDVVIAGSLAADAHEVPLVDELAEVIVGTDRRVRLDDVVAHRYALEPFEVVHVDGVRVTSPDRTAFDLARRLDLLDGVAMADALGRKHPVSPWHLRDLAGRHPNVRGLERVREVAGLMAVGAESLPESRVRVALVLRGVPAPVLQYRVLRTKPNGANSVVARPDLAWPRYRLALQYDGPEHLERRRRIKDIDQDDTLRAMGWLVLRVMSAQFADPDVLAARVLGELRLRGWRP